MPTDFEKHGLADGPARFGARHSLITVDFEAFSAESSERWCEAMKHWAQASEKRDLRASFFLAVEYAVRLRTSDRARYGRLLAAAADLQAAGCEFHPHAHGAFDPRTGERPRGRSPVRVAGYRRRPSVYHDVVYRNGFGWGGWLKSLLGEYETVLDEGRLARPRKLAFRAGGWDHGSSAPDLADYVRGLSDCGLRFDSSATSGVFGTRSWRVGSRFGHNAFRLGERLVEIAPCWSIDAGRIRSPRGIQRVLSLAAQPRLWSLRRPPGVFVTVLHFNELLDDGAPRRQVNRRIDRLLDALQALDRAFDLRSETFAGLEPTLS